MAETKKKAAVPKGKRPVKRAGLSWQVKRDENRTKLIAIIAVVGVIAVLAGYFLQANGIFSLHTDEEAIAGSTVRINEVVAQNMSSLITAQGEVPDWVEITNTGRDSVNIGHYGLLMESNINNMFSFPNYMLQPGECLVVCCEGAQGSGHGDFSAPFKIEASGGDRLILLNAKGKAVDAVELAELGYDEAYIRNDDGTWRVGTPTPGANNASNGSSMRSGVEVVADDIRISEVSSSNTLYFADENGRCHDYVELHNSSSTDVNLEGWYLSDSSDKLKRWSFPEVILPAGGYLAVHCSGLDNSDNPVHLHTDFKLGSDGENVYLSRPDGHTVSIVETPLLVSDQAYSLVDGEWTTGLAPTPGAANNIESAMQINTLTFGNKENALRINEIMASPTEQNYDWVEIYNGSSQTINLGGYGLSDSPDKPRKWQFPEGTAIQPGQYMGVFLSGKRESSIAGFLNADFALSSAGGFTVSLSDPDGNVLDAAYMAQQYGGVSYGRAAGKTGYCFFEYGTPGSANNKTYYRTRADEPKVSVKGGLFNSGDSFAVELSAPAGSRIYYTLDCSDPDESAQLYTGPIQVSSNTVLRSKVYRDGCMPSFIDTQSYIFDVQNASNVHVVSLVSDPANLYGNDGIISNYGMEWEREAHVEIFTADGTNIISQGCGISLHGQDSRKLPIKSFNVIARSQYGVNRLNYPIFSGRDYQSYQSILLRPSGEDYDMSFMRDTILSQLVKDTSVLYQEYEIAICYLNGEYHTLYYIRERVNEHSICQFEGWEGMEDEVDIVKGNSSVNQGSNATFAALLEWVQKNDTSTDSAYEYIGSQIDIDNFIEYMSLQIFTGNTDTLNVRRYRNANADGKWRWALFDLDWAFFNDTNSIKNWLTPGGTGAGKRTDNTLFIACMKNPKFCEKFLVYFGEQMATNFSSEYVVARIQERYERIKGVLPQYLEKWDLTLNNGLKKLVRYAEERPDKLLNTYFKDCFKFSDAQMEKYFGAALDKIEEYASRKAGE